MVTKFLAADLTTRRYCAVLVVFISNIPGPKWKAHHVLASQEWTYVKWTALARRELRTSMLRGKKPRTKRCDISCSKRENILIASPLHPSWQLHVDSDEANLFKSRKFLGNSAAASIVAWYEMEDMHCHFKSTVPPQTKKEAGAERLGYIIRLGRQRTTRW